MSAIITYREIQGFVDECDGLNLVTKSTDKEIYEDNKVDISVVKHDFNVDVGDCIKMLISFSDPSKLMGFEPWETLREHTGKITLLKDDEYGIVDDDIVFYIDDRIKDLNLKKDDEVRCMLIEGKYCADKEYTTRCETIERLNKDTINNSLFDKQPEIEENADSDMDEPNEPDMQFQALEDEPRSMHYHIPYSLFEKLQSGNSNVISKTLKEFIPKKLDYSTYRKRFHALIYLEEVEMKVSFNKYQASSVVLNPENKRFSIICSKIKELRPPIAIGDTVQVQREFMQPYRGLVEGVREDRLILKFRRDFIDFNWSPGASYSAVFFYSRTVFKRKHASIDYAKKKMPEQFLFPARLYEAPELQLNAEVVDGKLLLDKKEEPWFKAGGLNQEQKDTVVAALQGKCRPFPFIIFGPPGTGKTSTLIEIILQIYKNIPDCKILVGAQSNHAANVVASRLKSGSEEIGKDMVRLVSNAALDRKTLPPELLKYSASVRNLHLDDETMEEINTMNKNINDGVQRNIELEYLKQFKVIIGTCVNMGVMFGSPLSDNYFTHVLIDEAAQCNESEAMIPISFVDLKNGQVIMAGDPLQLPPISLSTHAKKFDLVKSMLERYLEMYKEMDGVVPSELSGYDLRLVAKLRRNYRSLPCVLEYYNDNFYEGQLIPTIDGELSAEAIKLRGLLHNNNFLPYDDKLLMDTKNPFGVYFVNVNGKNERLENKKSWSNKDEETIITEFVRRLLSMNVNSDDIGVISPYYAQVTALKKSLRKKKVRVGTVEEFQGEEKQIILISSVKTSGLEKALQFIFCP